ncbi:MAG: transketolase C-terminal domain-containing protein, partial [Candidatus Diapherotrites archaeon]|nr:transketolase C-terminal domain-containing protein [Candidatus Diapherotrites archaeon]
RAAKETKAILTAEDHQIIGGLGSAVSEVLAENNSGTKFKRIGMQNRFGESGKPMELYTKFGFTAENLAEQIKNLLK